VDRLIIAAAVAEGRALADEGWPVFVTGPCPLRSARPTFVG
jgi:hypothetical protein